MIFAISTFLISIIASTIFTLFGLKIAERLNFFDFPGKAKIHEKPIPYLGGLGIFAGILSGTLIATFFTTFSIAPIIVASISAFVFGLGDDLKLIKSVFAKIVLTIAIALIVSFLLQQQFDFNFLTIIISILWIFFAIHAENLIDGLDGLSAGTTAINALGFAVFGFVLQNNLLLFFGLILAGSSIGFLFFNFFPAKIFMGSSGSWQLGAINGTISIILLQFQNFSIQSIISIALINSILLFDVLTTIIRRIFAKKSIFLGDTMHFYNAIAEKKGQKKAVLLIYFIQAILSATALIALLFFK